MTEQVRNRQSNSTSGDQRPSKAERRAAAREAALRRAAARRRRQALLGALAGLAVVGVLIGSFVLLGRSDDGNDGTATATPTATASSARTDPSFPPLPEGADAALSSKPTVTAGKGELTKLTVTSLIKGKGAATQVGQTITVNYVGVEYRTGTEFDASWQRMEPFSFPLGAGRVIKGWDQGLVGVTVGSRVQVDIPAELAYGENPGNGAPGGPLRFVVDVLAAQ